MHFHQTQESNDDANFLQQLDQFSRSIHRSLRFDEVSGIAVNDGLPLLNVDRISLGVRAGRKCLIKAISGQDEVIKRSPAVKHLQELASSVVASNQPLYYSRNLNNCEQNSELANYVTESQARVLMILPLQRDKRALIDLDNVKSKPDQNSNENQCVGCLVIENFRTNDLSTELLHRSEAVAGHVANAVHNARQHNSIFLLPVLTGIGKSLGWFEGKKFWAAMALLATLSIFVAACFLLPWQYRVTAKGQLMPAVRRDIFAPWDGRVAKILVKDGQIVRQGDPMIELENNELQKEYVGSQTELNELRKLLVTLVQQADSERGKGITKEFIQLQGQISRAEIEVAGAQENLVVLKKRIDSLRIIAPIDGAVAAFDMEQLLTARPVQRGENLFQVVDPSQTWQLELEIPDHKAGHVLDASRQESESVLVDFVLATDVAKRRTGTLQHVGSRVNKSEAEGAAVEAIIALNATTTSEIEDKRYGAGVNAKVHCGYRSLGYVLFGDVIEFLATRFWL